MNRDSKLIKLELEVLAFLQNHYVYDVKIHHYNKGWKNGRNHILAAGNFLWGTVEVNLFKSGELSPPIIYVPGGKFDGLPMYAL